MKAHTSEFKTQIPLHGRELDDIITFTIDGVTTELGNEELNSITPHYEGTILKSVMKQLDIDSNVEIPVGTILTYDFGVKTGEEYEYITYGNYVVKSVEKQEDTNSYKITCYDKLLYSMKDYDNSGISFPITIKDYLEAICTKIGLTYEGSQFANSDKIIEKELYLDTEGRSIGYTFRNVLDEISAVAGGTICINTDDEVEVRYIHDVGELSTATGSNIAITDSQEAELSSFELEGKTTQETSTQGKNLFDSELETTSIGGVTLTYNGDGTITLNGTATSNATSYAFLKYPSGTTFYNLNANTQYSASVSVISGSMTLGSNTEHTSVQFWQPWDYSFQLFFNNISNNKVYVTKTPTASINLSRIQIAIRQNDVFNNFKIGIQFEQGAVTNFEKFIPNKPSPNYPSELNSVGYKNLFDKDNANVINAYLSGSMKIVASNDDRVIYIPCKPNTTYVVSKAVQATTASNRFSLGTTATLPQANTTLINFVYLGNGTVGTSLSIKTGSTAKYLVCGIYHTDSSTSFDEIKNSIQITETFLHPYISYGKYGIEVKTTKKNLFNTNNLFLACNINGNTGELTTNQSTRIALFMQRVEPSKTYTFSLNNNYQLGNIAKYDKNGNFISIINTGGWFNSYTVTLPNDTYYLSTTLRRTDNANVSASDLEALHGQLEEGTQATTYEEYKSNTYLYTLDNPLRSIGDTKDLLYIKNGMLYVERKIGSIVLDGTESGWGVNGSSHVLYRPISNKKQARSGLLSNYYKYTANDWSQAENNTISEQQNNNYIFIKNNDFSSVNNFKTWLGTHNTEVQYILATSYIEELGAVQTPSTYEGVTYIDAPNTINISYIDEFEEIDEEYLKDVNVNFGEKFGPVNTVILSRGGDGDKIALSIPENLADEDKVAIQITDNQIMNGNDRDEYLSDILNQLYNLEYYINDFSSTGICYLDLCDRYRIKIGDTSYKCVMLNDNVNRTQGLEENIYTDMPEASEQEYKYIGSTDRGITQANIIANKAEATITEYTQKVDEVNNRLNAVETKQTDTDRTINILSTHIDADGDITEVTTTTGFTFNADGMTIADSQSNFSALHRNDGTYYKDGNTIVGQYTKDGSKQKDLQLFGVYYYGMRDFDDTPMFVAQLYNDSNGEKCFGHFYNRGD